MPIAALWSLLIESLSPIWPSRLSLDGIPLGDVWPCAALRQHAPGQPASETDTEPEPEAEALVPFHKLTGWVTYSLIEPIQRLLGWTFQGLDDMTGLPEYRNGECMPSS